MKSQERPGLPMPEQHRAGWQLSALLCRRAGPLSGSESTVLIAELAMDLEHG